jgi:hypothetical protein
MTFCPSGCLSPPHLSQQPDPGAPPGLFHAPAVERSFDPVKGVLDQGVMHGFDQEAPLCPHPEIAVGIDNMSDQRAVPSGNHLEEMPAVEAFRQSLALELENDTVARHILRHAVPHGAVAAPGPFPECGVELHRGPVVPGPQLIHWSGEGVEGCPNIGNGCLNFPFVPVVDFHLPILITAI